MSRLVSDFLAFIQYRLGAEVDAAGLVVPDTSWSAQLQASERLWMVLEGTHVITIMLFAGTILFVDLRLLGVALRDVPVSRVSRAVLPYTVAGFAIMVLTGAALVFANPLEYFHSFVFRLKAVFLLLAAINIFWFHARVSKSQDAWDAQPRPPRTARLAAGTSIALWLLVIATGRYAAYDWFACDQASGFVAAVSQCETYHQSLAAAEAELAL